MDDTFEFYGQQVCKVVFIFYIFPSLQGFGQILTRFEWMQLLHVDKTELGHDFCYKTVDFDYLLIFYIGVDIRGLKYLLLCQVEDVFSIFEELLGFCITFSFDMQVSSSLQQAGNFNIERLLHGLDSFNSPLYFDNGFRYCPLLQVQHTLLPMNISKYIKLQICILSTQLLLHFTQQVYLGRYTNFRILDNIVNLQQVDGFQIFAEGCQLWFLIKLVEQTLIQLWGDLAHSVADANQFVGEHFL